GEPVVVRRLGVALDLGEGLVPAEGHQFMRRVASLGAPSHPAFLEPMQTAVIGQSSGSGPLREVGAGAVLLARLAIGRDDVSEMLLRHCGARRPKLRRDWDIDVLGAVSPLDVDAWLAL